MTDLVWLIPAFPLAGFLLILVLGRRLGDPRAGYLATAMVAASFVTTVAVFIDLLGDPADDRAHVVTLWSWLPVGNLQIDMAFLADQLSITMCLFVTGVGALIATTASWPSATLPTSTRAQGLGRRRDRAEIPSPTPTPTPEPLPHRRPLWLADPYLIQ